MNKEEIYSFLAEKCEHEKAERENEKRVLRVTLEKLKDEHPEGWNRVMKALIDYGR